MPDKEESKEKNRFLDSIKSHVSWTFYRYLIKTKKAMSKGEKFTPHEEKMYNLFISLLSKKDTRLYYSQRSFNRCVVYEDIIITILYNTMSVASKGVYYRTYLSQPQLRSISDKFDLEVERRIRGAEFEVSRLTDSNIDALDSRINFLR